MTKSLLASGIEDLYVDEVITTLVLVNENSAYFESHFRVGYN